MSQKNLDGSLNIYAQTWTKDTNGLFDFSSTEIINSKESIKENACLTRKNFSIKKKLNESKDPNEEYLFNIIKKENRYLFENKIDFNMEPNTENITKINNKLWYIINNNPKSNDEKNKKNRNKNYYLTKKDIIKLGRLKFNIIEDSLYSGDKKFELCIPNDASFINKQDIKKEMVFNLVKSVQRFIKENTEEKVLCRICYSEEDDRINNPMVHLCKCKGGINYAHFNCIKHWMNTKLKICTNIKETVKTYYIPRFNCEICKAPYPFQFKLAESDNKIYELIDIKRPKCNYIIMESLDQIKENNNNKYIYVIKIINEEDITIGRGIEADIKINDISVSRLHSKLNFNFANKSLLITDLRSKFGTLVLIQNSFELKEKDSLIIQSGRTLMKAEVTPKEKKKIFMCKKFKDYKKENVIKNSLINVEFKVDKEKLEINNENDMSKNVENINDYKINNDKGIQIRENESNNNSIDMEIDING